MLQPQFFFCVRGPEVAQTEHGEPLADGHYLQLPCRATLVSAPRGRGCIPFSGSMGKRSLPWSLQTFTGKQVCPWHPLFCHPIWDASGGRVTPGNCLQSSPRVGMLSQSPIMGANHSPPPMGIFPFSPCRVERRLVWGLRSLPRGGGMEAAEGEPGRERWPRCVLREVSKWQPALKAGDSKGWQRCVEQCG